MRLFACCLALVLAAVPAWSQACPIGALDGRLASAAADRYLAEASRVVRGTWVQTWESADGLTVGGYVEFPAWGRRTVRAVATRGDRCGFPNQPGAGVSEGEFYLKRIARGSYRVLHFVPERPTDGVRSDLSARAPNPRHPLHR
jgi:hypothetical protein